MRAPIESEIPQILQTQLNRTDRRKFLNICRHLPARKLENVPSPEAPPRWYCSRKRVNTAEEREQIAWIYKTAHRVGIRDMALRLFWEREAVRHKRDLHENRTDYTLKPVQEGKDNKDYYSGRGGGGSRNRIRVPRKVRSKGCWKRFYKLFPHLDPKNNVASN